MHGRRRAEYKALHSDPKVIAKLGAKAVAWHQLQRELLSRWNAPSNDAATAATTLALLEKALTVNPDPLWLWNFRRRLVLSNNNELFAWDTEARLTQTALEGNPKAYGPWNYRKACLVRACTTATTARKICQAELALTALLLQQDERNFHCWSYRRFVVAQLLQLDAGVGGSPSGAWVITDNNDSDDTSTSGRQGMGPQLGAVPPPQPVALADAQPVLQAEWEFTEAKIRDNFSNFSAFHYRSQLYDMLQSPPPKLCDEFALVGNAVCTEPDDQTAWWYQAFLLQKEKKSSQDKDDLASILEEHIELLQELRQETESKSKWVLLGLLHCLEHTEASLEERKEILETLRVVDPDRSQRYQDMMDALETG